VHVGDTVTWSNSGPSPHTATASNGSFNTGVLKKGQSASHTFTQAGTYSYICQIHPFMHGTVVVLAAITSTTPPSTSGASSGSGTAAAATATTAGTSTTAGAATGAPTLPNTGFDTLGAVLLGILLLGTGIRLRRLNG
jgi:LPXTG-motif cell wall-anchored protein